MGYWEDEGAFDIAVQLVRKNQTCNSIGLFTLDEIRTAVQAVWNNCNDVEAYDASDVAHVAFYVAQTLYDSGFHVTQKTLAEAADLANIEFKTEAS